MDDGAAFAALLRDQERPLRRMVARVSGSADPDDVRQELVLRAFQHRSRFVEWDTDHRCRWSRTVARNIAYRMFRAGRGVDLVAEVPEDAVVAPDPLELHVAADGRRELAAALDLLDPDTRYLVVARAVEGTPYAVLAAELDVPEAVLRQRFARARERLRVALTRSPLAVLPLRWVLRPSRSAQAARVAVPVAVSTLMLGTLALTLGPPGESGGPRPPAAASAVPRQAAREPVESPAERKPRPGATAPARAALPAAAAPAPVPPRDSGHGGHRGPRLPAKADAEICVNGTCVGTGDDEQPGDAISVDAPGPAGPQTVRQNAVPVCDTVPATDPIPMRCVRHE